MQFNHGIHCIMNIIQLLLYISYIHTYTLSISQKCMQSNYDSNLWMVALAWGACMLFEITWGRWSWISAFIRHKYNVMIKTAISTHIWGYRYWNRHHLTHHFMYLQFIMCIFKYAWSCIYAKYIMTWNGAFWNVTEHPYA